MALGSYALRGWWEVFYMALGSCDRAMQLGCDARNSRTVQHAHAQ